jgi:hypothetical protein
MRITTGTYTGDGVDNRWIVVGFEPDLVIVKPDLSQEATYRTSDMAVDESYKPYRFAGATTNRIQDFDATRFQIGTDLEVNQNGSTYYWVAVADDGVGDFAVGTYVGDAVDNRDIASGWQPTCVFIVGTNNSQGVWRIEENVGDDTLDVRNLANDTNRIQTFNATGFQVGTDDQVNKSGHTFYYAQWADVTGLFETGDYTGNAVDDRNIVGLGFEPVFVMIKGDITENCVFWIDTMDAGDSAEWTNTAPTTNYIQAALADGFQIGDDNRVNQNLQDYYWMAMRSGSSSTTSSSISSSSSSTSNSSSSSSSSTSVSSLSSSSSSSSFVIIIIGFVIININVNVVLIIYIGFYINIDIIDIIVNIISIIK